MTLSRTSSDYFTTIVHDQEVIRHVSLWCHRFFTPYFVPPSDGIIFLGNEWH